MDHCRWAQHSHKLFRVLASSGHSPSAPKSLRDVVPVLRLEALYPCNHWRKQIQDQLALAECPAEHIRSLRADELLVLAAAEVSALYRLLEAICGDES